jgi:hypothetical protein
MRASMRPYWKLNSPTDFILAEVYTPAEGCSATMCK